MDITYDVAYQMLMASLSFDDLKATIDLSSYITTGADRITDSLAPSDGNGWDGDWSSVGNPTPGIIALDADEAQVGIYAIRNTYINMSFYETRYIFDASINITAFDHITVKLKFGNTWDVVPSVSYFYLSSSASGTGFVGMITQPNHVYALIEDPLYERITDGEWTTLTFSLVNPDYIFGGGADLSSIRRIVWITQYKSISSSSVFIDGISLFSTSHEIKITLN